MSQSAPEPASYGRSVPQGGPSYGQYQPHQAGRPERPEQFLYLDVAQTRRYVPRRDRTPIRRALIGAAAVVAGAALLSRCNGPGKDQQVSLGTTDQGVSFTLLIDTDNNRLWAESSDDRFGDAVVINADTGQPLNSDVTAALSNVTQARVMAYDYPSCSPLMVILNYNHDTGAWDPEPEPSSQAPFIRNNWGSASVVENCKIQFAMSQGRSLTD